MKISLKNKSVKARLITNAAIIMAIMMIAQLYALISMNNIGVEIKAIAEQDIPLTEQLTRVATLQLEQAIRFERAVRYGEKDLKQDQASSIKFKDATAQFDDFDTRVIETLKNTEIFAAEANEKARTDAEKQEFEKVVKTIKLIKSEHADYARHAQQVFSEFNLNNNQGLESLISQVQREEDQLDEEIKTLLLDVEKFTEASALLAEAHEQAAIIVMIILFILGIGIMAALTWWTVNVITNRIDYIKNAVVSVSEGNYDARTGISGEDELGLLGTAFDSLLNERVATLAEAERESERLNNSIIDLIRTVAVISQKDFTVKVPVKEDVTGAVSDSLNLLTSETSEILNTIRNISNSVSVMSAKVKKQGNSVISVAKSERVQVEESSRKLDETSRTMMRISQDAQSANQQADQAMTNTQVALDSVNKTVEGINQVRDTISEAEKRIKRLGERTQEITGVVNLINTIAERTHILALNASMHAASAGEAGRGFAVVADEVQRLAENAREATLEISTLVNNIHLETADTVATMNNVISQVAEGTQRAEEAGDNMKKTQSSTNELVTSVRQIADSSQDQAKASLALREESEKIKDSTMRTAKELQEQSAATDDLTKFAALLVKTISVFKLPQPKSRPQSDKEAA